MDSESWYNYFIDTLYEKFPKKSKLIEELMGLLYIEREAVYRRLRKDVMFSIGEVMKISSAWNISLDKITGVNTGQIHFLMHTINYIEPSEQDINFLRLIIKSINGLQKFSDTEFMDICNKLPRQLLAGYAYLNKFYLFKWMYQYGPENNTPFSQIVVSDEMLQLTAEYYQAIKNVPNTNFIFDHALFEYLVCDIRYFHSIRMITNEEKELIKNELYDLLEYLLDIATKGYYPETTNKVNLYISHINVDTNYSYTYTHDAKISFVHVFDKYEIYTLDRKMVENFKTWMQLKKRTSTQISEVDEKNRFDFFMKQRLLIDEL